MSRIYQPKKINPTTPVNRDESINNRSEGEPNVITTNQVASNIKLFTKSLNNSSSPTPIKKFSAPVSSASKHKQNGAAVNGVNGSSHSSEELHPSVSAFDDLMSGFLKPFMATSSQIGKDVNTIAELVNKSFEFERAFLLEASRCTEPAQDVLQAFYVVFTKKIEEVTSLREKSRKSEFFNNLSAISESIGALGWIAMKPAPSPYVKEMNDSAQFYTNRVLKEFKEKDPKHAQWVKQWIQLLNELQAYVKQYHTTGVVWNSTKRSLKFNSNLSSAPTTNGSSAPKPAGPPGLPPPPLPNFKDLFADDSKKAAPIATDALFAEINKGAAITSGLKKVSDDQKTHKNPNLRSTAVVPGSAKTSSSSDNYMANKSVAANKPPVFELADKQWKIEYQNKRNDLVIEKTEIKQTIYIYKCKECTITVKGKVNSIFVDTCSRVALLFDDVLSTVEFVNSQMVQMQCLGNVPTVCVEKTDGCQVYLSKKSLQTEIVSSKSSAMNILVPNAEGDEYEEQPVPEQFKTVIGNNGKLKTFATEC